jgi:chromosome segregation ATPase
MAENNLDQTNQRLDRLEEVLVSQNQTVDRIIEALAQGAESDKTHRRRLNQHDQELDDQDARTERLERILETHETKMEELRNIHADVRETQADIRSILQIMTRRLSGEPPA